MNAEIEALKQAISANRALIATNEVRLAEIITEQPGGDDLVRDPLIMKVHHGRAVVDYAGTFCIDEEGES